jgi:hypothetical protein
MADDNMKVIKYSGILGSKVKYAVAKTIIGTVIKCDNPFLRVKTDLGKIIEIAKEKVLKQSSLYFQS